MTSYFNLCHRDEHVFSSACIFHTAFSTLIFAPFFFLGLARLRSAFFFSLLSHAIDAYISFSDGVRVFRMFCINICTSHGSTFVCFPTSIAYATTVSTSGTSRTMHPDDLYSKGLRSDLEQITSATCRRSDVSARPYKPSCPDILQHNTHSTQYPCLTRVPTQAFGRPFEDTSISSAYIYSSCTPTRET